MHQELKSSSRPYSFCSSDDFGRYAERFYASDDYAWSSRAVRVASPSISPESAHLAGPQVSVVVNVKGSPKEIMQVSFDEDGIEMKVRVCFFDPQTSRREKHLLLIFQVDEVQSLLCAIVRTRENEKLEST